MKGYRHKRAQGALLGRELVQGSIYYGAQIFGMQPSATIMASHQWCIQEFGQGGGFDSLRNKC